MKHILSFLLPLCFLFASCASSSDIDDLQKQIDDLKSDTRISSIETQIEKINSSITDLEKMDVELNVYIKTLQEQKKSLEEADANLSKKIDDIKAEMLTDKDLESLKSNILSQLTTYQTTINGQISSLQTSINSLQNKDLELQQKINDLKSYVDGQIQNVKDWASATFVTLDKYSSTTEDISSIKSQIESINEKIAQIKVSSGITEGELNKAISDLDSSLQAKIANAVSECNTAIENSATEITAAYQKAISEAISTCESGMKTWVNEQLTGYYTIAEVNAILEALKADLPGSDSGLEKEIKDLESALETAKANIKSAYEQAISDAIAANNGTINAKIAADIKTASDALQSQINAIVSRVSSLESRMSNVEEDVSMLISRIQSIAVIPQYNDGSVFISNTSNSDINFEIYPTSIAESLAQKGTDILSMKAVYTASTKATVSLVSLPVVGVTYSSGIFTVTVNARGALSDEFFAGEVSASARLLIQDANNSRTSEYFALSSKLPEPKMVDLGLSVKWASFNLGATKPEDCGLYYQWGDTQGYGSDTSDGKFFYWHDKDVNICYKWGTSFGSTLTKYNTKSNYGAVDNKTVLEMDDDAARVALGSNWRMPTDAECAELVNTDNCSWTWTTINGVNGCKVQSLKSGYTDNWIFLPAAGYRSSGELYNDCSGKYWSSSLDTGSPIYAYIVDFFSNIIRINSDYRFKGYSVRPVYCDVTGVSINKVSTTIEVGSSETLIATVTSTSKSANRKVEWSSSDTSIATVDDSGKVTAVSSGNAVITATTVLGGFSATCNVVVPMLVPELVDLGLSVKWASFNLGASKPEGYGLYFQWGDTQGYSSNTSDGKYFAWSHNGDVTYKWCNGSSVSLTKYNANSNYGTVDNKTVLDMTDDAAGVALGGNWRMPTDAEWTELRNPSNCSWTWTMLNDVYGYKVQSKKTDYTDNWIFLPAAGYRLADNMNGVGAYGRYWSSSLCTGGSAYMVEFISSGFYRSYTSRSDGYTVRPVSE